MKSGCGLTISLVIESAGEFLRSVTAPIPSPAEDVDGMKISAIDHRRDVAAKIDEMLAPLELFGLVLRAKGNVMH